MILVNISTGCEIGGESKCGSLTNNEISQDLQTADLSGLLAHRELGTLAEYL